MAFLEWGREMAVCGREEGSTLYVHIQWEKDSIPRAIFLQGVDITFFLEKAQIFLETKILWKRGEGGESLLPLDLSLGC